MLGGHIDVYVASPRSMVPLQKDGRARMLGVSSAQRDKGYAETPTFKEQGIDAEFFTWRGFMGPKGLKAGEIAYWDAVFEKLAQSGVLNGVSPELLAMLKAGELPADAATLAQLTAALSGELASANARMGQLAELGEGFGRFDPADFPIGSGKGMDGDGPPGRGGITRGRGDAAPRPGRARPLRR